MALVVVNFDVAPTEDARSLARCTVARALNVPDADPELRGDQGTVMLTADSAEDARRLVEWARDECARELQVAEPQQLLRVRR